MHKRYKETSNRKKVVGTLVFIAVCGTVFWLLQSYATQRDRTTDTDEGPAKSTSQEPAAQEDFNTTEVDPHDTAKNREPGNSIREDQGSAGIIDTGGTTEPIASTKPSSSSTGEIIVFSPQPNQTVKGEITVTGESSLKSVMYRISDDVSGVLTTGPLNVVGGKFSGKLKISTGAKTGQVSFFGTKSDGNEFSNVTIPLKF